MTNDPYGLTASGLPPEIAARARGLTRQQAIAEAMLQQSQAPLETNRMAGGYVVPISPFEGLASLAKGFVGRKSLDDADAKALALGNEYQNMTANEVARYMAKKTGTPESTIPAAPYEAPIGAEDSSAQTGAPVTVPATPADPRAAVMEAIASRNPMLQKLGSLDYAQMAKAAEPYTLAPGAVRIGPDGKPIASAPFKPDAPKVQPQSNLARLIAERDQIPAGDPRRAAYDNAIRKESETARQISPTIVMPRAEKPDKVPMGFRATADGNLEPIPGGPADLKAEAERQKKAAGAGDVDIALTTLRDAYSRLENGGGITSTKTGPLGNAMAALSASGIGQTVGKALGTENQSARNDIAMARPGLLAALMKATGMSAKQMDSNAELKLWLSTATDPTLDIESNRRALDNIERKYINGPGARPAVPAPKPNGASGGWEVVR